MVCACAFTFAFAADLAAHSLIRADSPPSSRQNAVHIERPDVSQVYYGEVSPSEPAVWFTFEADPGDVAHFNVGIPKIDRLEELNVVVALIGPGLDEATPVIVDYGRRAGEPLPDVCADIVGPGESGLLFEEGPERRVFHEHFTDTVSWVVVQADVEIQVTGVYYLAAFARGTMPPAPKLWLAIGTKERFTLSDVFGIRRLIRFVRAFHETSHKSLE